LRTFQGKSKSNSSGSKQLLVEVARNDALASAASTIGITIYVDELKVLMQSIENNMNLRRESNSPRRIVNKAQLKTEIIDSFDRC